MPSTVEEITTCLRNLSDGNTRAADRLMPLVYDELRALAADYLSRERSNHTFQPTALVNEAYLKLVDTTGINWKGRAHFFAVAASAIRRILIDHARKHSAEKRGGDWQRVTITPEADVSSDQINLLALDDALQRLSEMDRRKCQVVELRYFGGLDINQTAEVIGVSHATVERDWTMARAWLFRELSDDTHAN